MTVRAGHHARLTPGRVRSVSFRLARLGRRGFDEDDVRDFCDRVEGELSLLLEERTALQAEVRRLRGWAQAINQRRVRVALPPGATPSGARPQGARPQGALPPGVVPPGVVPSGRGPSGHSPAAIGPSAAGPLSAPVSLPVPSPPYERQVARRPQPADPNDQALRILAQAQQTAERCVSDAHAYSQEVAHEAQRRRDKILAEASTKATAMLEHAHQVAIRNNVTPDTGRGRQPAPRSAPPPVPPDYSDIAARYPTATRDYRALHRHDPRSAYGSGPGPGASSDALLDPRSARDPGPGYDPRPAYGSATGYGSGSAYDSGPGSATGYGSGPAYDSGLSSDRDPRTGYGASSGTVFDPRSAHDSDAGASFKSAPVYDSGPSSAHNPRHTYGSGVSHDSAPVYSSGPSSGHSPRHTFGSSTSSAHDPHRTDDSGLTDDPRTAPGSGLVPGSGPAPGPGSASASGSASDPRSVYNSPTYGSPSYNTGQPGPGADYSTVIGYPGPAADYRAPQVPPARPPDSPEPRRDDEGYSDGYGDPRFGDSRFPF